MIRNEKIGTIKNTYSENSQHPIQRRYGRKKRRNGSKADTQHNRNHSLDKHFLQISMFFAWDFCPYRREAAAAAPEGCRVLKLLSFPIQFFVFVFVSRKHLRSKQRSQPIVKQFACIFCVYSQHKPVNSGQHPIALLDRPARKKHRRRYGLRP